MRGRTKRELESARPTIDTLEAVDFCLQQLFRDRRHCIDEEVVAGLTFEELIGALLLSRDTANNSLTVAPDAQREAHTSAGDGSVTDSVCHAKLGHHDDPRPHHCLLPAGHEGRHFCHICGLYWDTPNKEMSIPAHPARAEDSQP
jgi:hypothetical protein